MISPRKSNSEGETKLTPVQNTVLAALTAGRSYVEAAKEAGISDRTIRRWRECSPEFEQALRDHMQAIRESIIISASVATQSAVKTLAAIASNEDHPQVLRAIQLLLNLSGPLPQIKAPTSIAEVADEQLFATTQRFAARGY